MPTRSVSRCRYPGSWHRTALQFGRPDSSPRVAMRLDDGSACVGPSFSQRGLWKTASAQPLESLANRLDTLVDDFASVRAEPPWGEHKASPPRREHRPEVEILEGVAGLLKGHYRCGAARGPSDNWMTRGGTQNMDCLRSAGAVAWLEGSTSFLCAELALTGQRFESSTAHLSLRYPDLLAAPVAPLCCCYSTRWPGNRTQEEGE